MADILPPVNIQSQLSLSAFAENAFVEPAVEVSRPRCPWSERAEELLRWTLQRLVVRRDVSGEYTPAELIGTPFVRRDGTPGVWQDIFTRHGFLSDARILRHWRAEHRQDLLGLHFADSNNFCRCGALDVDQHGTDVVRAEANLTASLFWYRALVRRGFLPLLTSSNGAGGYHLRVLLASAIDAARVYQFMRELCSDYRQHGLSKPPETFPKQKDVRRCDKKLGNWLRLPGKHHKRAYWSQIWDGFRWLEGDLAVGFLLDLTGDDPTLIPEVPTSTQPAQPKRPTFAQRKSSPLMTKFLNQKAAAYISKLPTGKGVGEGRDDDGFPLACFLVRDLGLTDAEALPWMETWDNKNAEAKGEERLGQLIVNAHLYGQTPDRSKGKE
jgi:hypothetical protein